MERGKVLDTAKIVINGDRQDSYGNPEDSFATLAEYWTTFLKSKGVITQDSKLITARDTCEMMTLFKVARMAGQKPAIDNYVDGAGYLGIAGDMVLVEQSCVREM